MLRADRDQPRAALRRARAARASRSCSSPRTATPSASASSASSPTCRAAPWPAAATRSTGLLGEIDKAFSLQSTRLHLFAAVILAYAPVEGIEAVGLWYQRRWAEYLTFLVTASLLPLEIYELANRLSPFKILAFVINVAVVVYLLVAKRLFGLRGGAAADEAIRADDVGWPALERTAPEAAAP